MRKHYIAFLILLVIALGVSACNLPRSTTNQPTTTEAVYTQAAQTIIARLTQVAPAPSPTPIQEIILPTVAVSPLASPTVSPPTGTPAPSDTPPVSAATQPEAANATPTEPSTVLFEDDFSNKVGWYTAKEDDFEFQFSDGGYRISVNTEESFVWSIRSAGSDDVVLEVDAAHTGGPENGYYGLVCRQEDSENYYALVVASDGSYGIARDLESEIEFLEQGTAPSGVIQGGENVNRLRVACIGNTLTLYANGQKLAEVQDDSFDSGDVGLLAGTQDQGGMEAWFDNFVIYQP
jgi:hypothetical protein